MKKVIVLLIALSMTSNSFGYTKKLIYSIICLSAGTYFRVNANLNAANVSGINKGISVYKESLDENLRVTDTFADSMPHNKELFELSKDRMIEKYNYYVGMETVRKDREKKQLALNEGLSLAGYGLGIYFFVSAINKYSKMKLELVSSGSNMNVKYRF